MPREELQRNIRRTLTDHEMGSDKSLENDGPCRVAQAVLQCAEHFCNASLAGVGSDENVLDVLGLWGGILNSNCQCPPGDRQQCRL